MYIFLFIFLVKVDPNEKVAYKVSITALKCRNGLIGIDDINTN